MTDFPNQFPEGLECNVDICDLVLSCIENNTDIQRAIGGFSSTSSIISTTPINPTIEALDSLSGQSVIDCDYDNMFGATTGITDLFNAISSDFYEMLIAATNAARALEELIKAIPVVETLPFDEAIGFAGKLADQVAEAYDAAYTTQVRDEIRCELFCIGLENCSLTLVQIRDYFRDKLVSPPQTGQDFLAIVEDILVNNWIGEQAIWVSHLLIVETLLYGGEFTGIDANKLVFQISALWNDPDPDWSILCTDCQWTYTVDLTTTLGVWTVDPTRGQWINGVGVQATNGLTRMFNNGIATPNNVTSCEMTFSHPSSSYQARFIVVGDTTYDANQNFAASAQSVYTQDAQSVDNVTDITLTLNRSGEPASNATITAITITGIGNNPFV
jgi:hypothetical protein